MDYVEYGKTGVQVSVAGLGCGGHSRLGQSQGRSVEDSVKIVKTAMDLGITLIDTAVAYGTEDIVGRAIQGRRDEAVLSTKVVISKFGAPEVPWTTPEQLRESLEGSLRRLKTDYIDIFNLHGVAADQYKHCQDHLMPEMQKLKDQGKIRLFGITERFVEETRHEMLDIALQDDFWQSMMIGFNLLNPSARHTIFKRTQAKGIGTLCMFAVRRALSTPSALNELLQTLVAEGSLPKEAFDADDPLGFLTKSGDASSVPNAAYRYCRHTPGVDVVLTGTGKIEHLKQNVASILEPPLSKTSMDRLDTLFGKVASVSGN